MNCLPRLLSIMLLLAIPAAAQSTPRIKSDPQFDRDLAVVSYLYALDLMVGLTTSQASEVFERICQDCEPDRWQLSTVSAVCRGDQFTRQGLWMHHGIAGSLTSDQKRYFETYNNWRHPNRENGLTLERYIELLDAQVRSIEESKVHLLKEELNLSEDKVKLLRVLSKRKTDDFVKSRVSAWKRDERFRLALERVPEGSSLLDGFGPGGALEAFEGEDLREFLTLDKLSNQHPAVAVRPDQPDWDRFVREILDDVDEKRFAEFRREREKRQARYVAHVFVAKWTPDMDLEYRQRVNLMELISENLTPPFSPSLYLSRVENKRGLKTVPREKYAAIVGEEYMSSLLQSINDEVRYW